MKQKVTIETNSNAARPGFRAIFACSALLVLLLFAYVTEHQAQIRDPQMTKLSGVVVNEFLAGLGQVDITAKKNGKIITRTRTEVDGKYELDLMPGIYSLEFKRFPFISFEVPRYVVPIGAKFWKLDVCLECEDCGEVLELPGI